MRQSDFPAAIKLRLVTEVSVVCAVKRSSPTGASNSSKMIQVAVSSPPQLLPIQRGGAPSSVLG